MFLNPKSGRLNIPEAAIKQARLPTEFPTRTVGFLTISSKKSNINYLQKSLKSVGIELFNVMDLKNTYIEEKT